MEVILIENIEKLNIYENGHSIKDLFFFNLRNFFIE